MFMRKGMNGDDNDYNPLDFGVLHVQINLEDL